MVDLAVARGGDTHLLESLTSDTAGGIKQPRALLAEQFSTLKYALTRPNVQFLIYEVHTILPSETTEMIRQVVEYANQLATEKYIREHPVSESLYRLKFPMKFDRTRIFQLYGMSAYRYRLFYKPKILCVMKS